MAPSALLLTLIEVALGSFFIGVFAVLSMYILRMLIDRLRSRKGVHVFFLAASLFMFSLSVVFIGLVIQGRTISETSAAFLVNARVKAVVAIVLATTADTVLIWRVWLVWGPLRYNAVAIPIMLVCSAIAFALHLIITLTSNVISNVSIILLAVNNILCTCLIAGRILYIRHQNDVLFGNMSRIEGYMSAVLLIVESGTIYSLLVLLQLALSFTDSPGARVVNVAIIPLLGVLPTLIVVIAHHSKDPGSAAVSESTRIASMSDSAAAKSRSQPTTVTFTSTSRHNHGDNGSFESSTIGSNHSSHVMQGMNALDEEAQA